MKITVDIPDDIIHPIKRIAEGFNIPIERAAAIALADWIASMDASFTLYGEPKTPAYRAFDEQFNDQTPEGYTIDSSYEKSRANWMIGLG